jgi:hypothetical protein
MDKIVKKQQHGNNRLTRMAVHIGPIVTGQTGALNKKPTEE